MKDGTLLSLNFGEMENRTEANAFGFTKSLAANEIGSQKISVT